MRRQAAFFPAGCLFSLWSAFHRKPAGGGTVVLLDTFTDADQTILTTGHTPDTGPNWTGDSTYYKIIGNALENTRGSSIRVWVYNACFPQGYPNQYTIEFDLTPNLAASGDLYRVHAKYVSSTDFLRAEFEPGVNTVRIQDGSGTLASGSYSFTDGSPHTVKMEVVGNQLTVYVNDTQVVQASSTQGATGTQIALESGDVDGWKLDNFKVTEM